MSYIWVKEGFQVSVFGFNLNIDVCRFMCGYGVVGKDDNSKKK